MDYEITLSEEEAEVLANELKEKLQAGEMPPADMRLIKLMVAGLGDHRGLLRRTFSESLGKVGQAALPLLTEALINNPSVTVRRAAAKTLKLIGDPSALPDLLKALLNDSDPVVQGSSAGAMAIFGEEAVKLLLEVFISPSSNAMQCGLASWALAFVGAEAPNALKDAAQSSHAAIRAAAIAALGDQIHSLEDKAAQNLLLKALSDPISNVRVEATILIGKLHQRDWAQPHLIQKLSDSNSQVRKSAALSLMELRATKSVENLRERELEEKNADVLKVIKLAITQLNKEPKIYS